MSSLMGVTEAQETFSVYQPTVDVHEGEGKRVLKVVNDDGRVTADLAPVKR